MLLCARELVLESSEVPHINVVVAGALLTQVQLKLGHVTEVYRACYVSVETTAALFDGYAGSDQEHAAAPFAIPPRDRAASCQPTLPNPLLAAAIVSGLRPRFKRERTITIGHGRETPLGSGSGGVLALFRLE